MSIQLFFGLNGAFGPDVNATAFINAVQGSGYTMSTTEQNAIRTLVFQLKTNGIWNKLYAFYPMIGNTAASHKWNLKNPVDSDAAFRLVFNGSPTHNSNGVVLNGTSQYMDTRLIPGSVIAQNSLSIGMYQKAGLTTSPYSHGCINNYATTGTELYFTTQYIGINSNGENNANATLSGTWTVPAIVIGNVDSSNASIWYNGTQEKSAPYAGGSLPNIYFYIGAINYETNAAMNYISGTFATFFIARSITGSIAAMNNIISNFNTTLSR